MFNRLIILSVFVLVFATGCTSNEKKSEVASVSKEQKADIAATIAKVKKEVDALVKVAKANQKKAASVGGEWRDIGKMLKKVKKLRANGQCEQAIKVLHTAIEHGEMGYKQAIAQKQLKMPKYFKF